MEISSLNEKAINELLQKYLINGGINNNNEKSSNSKNIIGNKRKREESTNQSSTKRIFQAQKVEKKGIFKEEKKNIFTYEINDIYKNVLDFNFYKKEVQIEEKIPSRFENDTHYKNIWIPNFFNELKYRLLNEKMEKSEIQNYVDADIILNLEIGNDINKYLTSAKITPNKNLDEFNKSILKDKDIIALYEEKIDIDESKITLKNENNLNYYFLGIIIRDSNTLNLYILREQYKEYQRNNCFNKEENNYSNSYPKRIKYLGNINSSFREYNALFNLKISNFPKILNNNTKSLDNNIENLNINPTFNLFDFDDSQKEAIYQVSKMKDNDILLIQGPPGTGKTRTILGIISMLLKYKDSKLLICAPSNTAIDEICVRLAMKYKYNDCSEVEKCNFLRFGIYDRKDTEKKYFETDNKKILENYTLEHITDRIFKKDIDNLKEQIKKVRNKLDDLEKEKKNEKDINKLNILFQEIKNCKNSLTNLSASLSKIKNKKYLCEKKIISSTKILCTTLNSSGNKRLIQANLSYEYLIVDEASQGTEPSCLIPLFHNIKKFILVGDHMQLPATVFSPNASKILYNRSLFERINDSRIILTMQYRMQKNISEFISETFYGNKLKNNENQMNKINKELIYDIIKIENNFSFFNINYGKETREEEKMSYINESEINFSFDLIKNIIKKINEKIEFFQKEKERKDKISQNELNGKIKALKNYKFSIICPYKAQKMKFIELKKNDKFFMNKDLNNIEINTIDSFQGKERDIIIVSTVRANCKEELINLEEDEISIKSIIPEIKSNEKNSKDNIGIGFLNDFRRMNVGLSRAKLCCFVIGHYNTLYNNNYWNKLFCYCEKKHSFFTVDKEGKTDIITNIFK